MKKVIFSVFLSLFFVAADAQVFGSDKTYPLSWDQDKRVMTGFITPSVSNDEDIYARALLWTVETICKKQLEGIGMINHKTKSFTFHMSLESGGGTKNGSMYYCDVQMTVKEGRLVFYVSNITTQGKGFVKKLTPFESLQIEKKPAHKDIADEFTYITSTVINQIEEYINTKKTTPITHWSAITARRPEKGMTPDECRLAFGKPQLITENNENEEQWMYTSTFYLFFKNGVVDNIIK